VRAKPNAPVAVPLTWSEVDDPQLTSNHYTIQNIFARLSEKGDPWKDIDAHAREITQARLQCAALLADEAVQKKS
jgi:bifunctional non-homologous end joining protein LigD